jgi:hypothetical protein
VRFIEGLRSDDPELAAKLRVEERGLRVSAGRASSQRRTKQACERVVPV